MLADDRHSYWLNDTHWVPHPPTDVPSPPKKRKRVDDLPVHKTGSARTEGIYKVDSKQKQRHKVCFPYLVHSITLVFPCVLSFSRFGLKKYYT